MAEPGSTMAGYDGPCRTGVQPLPWRLYMALEPDSDSILYLRLNMAMADQSSEAGGRTGLRSEMPDTEI